MDNVLLTVFLLHVYNYSSDALVNYLLQKGLLHCILELL